MKVKFITNNLVLKILSKDDISQAKKLSLIREGLEVGKHCEKEVINNLIESNFVYF